MYLHVRMLNLPLRPLQHSNSLSVRIQKKILNVLKSPKYIVLVYNIH